MQRLFLIDSHSHINFRAFNNDWHEVIQRSLDKNIGCIVVGANLATSQKALRVAGNFHNGVWASVGLHPVYITARVFQADQDQPATLINPHREAFSSQAYERLALNQKVVAVGECGLDWTIVKTKKDKELQKKTLIKQISLADKLNLPLILHCREAYDALYELLSQVRFNRSSQRGVLHFFAGTSVQAREFIELGFYISFTGVVTFTHDYDQAVKAVPLERLLLETDSPYAAPTPFRGKRNEPLYVLHTLRQLARLKGVSENELAKITKANTVRLFDLNH